MLARGACDPRSADAWSLGVTVFALAYGFLPFVIADASRDWRYAAFVGRAKKDSLHDCVLSWYGADVTGDEPPFKVAHLLEVLLRVAPSERARVTADRSMGPRGAAALLRVHFSGKLAESVSTSCTYNWRACIAE